MKIKTLLLVLIVCSFLIRFIRIDYPKAYVFDEVYYPFTANEYLKGNKDAWTYWATPPKDHAYAWVNPPLPQEIMALSMKIFNQNSSFAWRIPGVLIGVISIYLIFVLGKILFKNERVALISAFLFSMDGLNFVQSRTAMLDIYLVTFCLLSLIFILLDSPFLSAIFFALAISSKWTAIYLLIIFIPFLIAKSKYLNILYFVIITPLIYLAIYAPFFLTGHNFKQFEGLINQEVWYHTHLKATHDYASSWWSWPLNLYPIWYFVEYGKTGIANIFASGTPLLYWLGSIAILGSIYEIIKKKSFPLFITVLGFLAFWLPWALSPRIMFLYYFAPSVPFFCLSLGYWINEFWEDKQLFSYAKIALILILVNFLVFYPILTGVMIPKNFLNVFFRTNLAKNPFR